MPDQQASSHPPSAPKPSASVEFARSPYVQKFPPFYSSQVLLPGEDASLFIRMRDALFDSMQPESLVVALEVDQIFADLWRLRRFLSIERANMVYRMNEKPEERTLEAKLSSTLPHSDATKAQLHFQTLLAKIKDLNVRSFDLIAELRDENSPLARLVKAAVEPRKKQPPVSPPAANQ